MSESVAVGKKTSRRAEAKLDGSFGVCVQCDSTAVANIVVGNAYPQTSGGKPKMLDTGFGGMSKVQ